MSKVSLPKPALLRESTAFAVESGSLKRPSILLSTIQLTSFSDYSRNRNSAYLYLFLNCLSFFLVCNRYYWKELREKKESKAYKSEGRYHQSGLYDARGVVAPNKG